MIVVVTPNVALDRTLVLPLFEHGAVLRPSRVIAAAGGKGLNVARAIGRFGGHVCAMGMLGGHTGAQVAALAAAEGLACRWSAMAAETRVCTIVVESAPGITTGMYEPGQPLPQADWQRFVEDVVAESREAAAVCICGSLPVGVDAQRLADLVARLKACGRQVWIDTSGAALEAALGAVPWAIKVNADEAAALLRRPIGDVAGAVAAAEVLRGRGVQLVAITLGGNGAVLAADDQRWWAQPPTTPILSAAGSGDAFLGALVQAITTGASYDDALRLAVAAGTANAEQPGGGGFTRERAAGLSTTIILTRC